MSEIYIIQQTVVTVGRDSPTIITDYVTNNVYSWLEYVYCKLNEMQIPYGLDYCSLVLI